MLGTSPYTTQMLMDWYEEARNRIAELEAEVARLQGALDTIGNRYQALLTSHREILEEMRERAAQAAIKCIDFNWDDINSGVCTPCGQSIAETIRALPLTGDVA